VNRQDAKVAKNEGVFEPSAELDFYLKATRFHLGLIINFGADVLQRDIKRVVRSP
jgi:hypothetical protein